MKGKFVEFADANDFADELIERSVPSDDAVWLSQFLLNILPPDTSDEVVMAIGTIFHRYGKSRDAALVATLFSLTGFGPAYVYSNNNERVVLDSNKAVQEWACHEIDFAKGLRFLSQSSEREALPLHKYAKCLVEWKLLKEPTIDIQWVRNKAEHGGSYSSSEQSNPDTPLFWFQAIGRSPFQHWIKRSLESEPDDTIGYLARGWDDILYGTTSFWDVDSDAPPDYAKRVTENASILATSFPVLNARVEAGVQSPYLMAMWFKYACHTAMAEPFELKDETTKNILKSAHQTLGRLRPLLRQAHEEAAAMKFDRDLITHAAEIIVRLDGLWKAEQALILCFRALSTPAVANDLRYWNEARFAPAPEPWFWIPMLMTGFLHTFAREQENHDPQLLLFRQQFCRFLLDRLKPSQKPSLDNTLVESDANWRYACIRACEELKVNPEGRGHHVLYQVVQNDPDSNVQDAARTAYDSMRHGASLPRGVSPRRAVLAAFWWLRQAHLVSLGVEIDKKGAQRTRAKEVRRSKEQEQ